MLLTWSHQELHVTRLPLDKHLYSSIKNVWCGLNTETVVCFNSQLMKNVLMCLFNLVAYSELVTYGV